MYVICNIIDLELKKEGLSTGENYIYSFGLYLVCWCVNIFLQMFYTFMCSCIIVICLFSIWNAFFAWLSLFLGGFLVSITFLLYRKTWSFFIFFFLFVGSLSVLFLYFVSIQGNPLFVIVPNVVVFLIIFYIKRFKYTSISCYRSYLVNLKFLFYMFIGVFFLLALLSINRLLGKSSFAFRPLCL